MNRIEKMVLWAFGWILMTSLAEASADCGLPTPADDRNFLADALQRVPLKEEQLRALGLRRFTAPDRSFSLVIPGNWKRFPAKKYRPLLLKQRGSSTVASELLLTRVPMSHEFIQKHPGVSAMEFYYRGVTSQERKNHGILEPLKILRLPDKLYGGFVVKGRVKGHLIYQYHSLMQTGTTLYDLALFGDAANRNYVRFLALIGGFSLWTPEDCRNDRHAPSAVRKTGMESVSKADRKSTPVAASGTSFRRDRALIGEVLRAVPGIRSKLRQFPLQRQTRKGISLILPSTWKHLPPKDEDTLLALRGYTHGNLYEVEISRLTGKKEKTRRNTDPEKLVMTVIKMLSDKIINENRKSGLETKIMVYPQPEHTDTGTAAMTLVQVGKNGQSALMGIGVVYDGQDLYFILTTTQEKDPDYVRFFTDVMTRSLHTVPESRKAERSGDKARPHNRKGNAVSSRAKLHTYHYAPASFRAWTGSGHSPIPIRDVKVTIETWSPREKRIGLTVKTSAGTYREKGIYCFRERRHYHCAVEDDAGYVNLRDDLSIQADVDFSRYGRTAPVVTLHLSQRRPGSWVPPGP